MSLSSSLPDPAVQLPARRYLVRTAAFMGLYAVLNVAAILGAFDAWVGTAMGWLLALAVASPVAGQIWAVLRLTAESDEYMRALWAKRFILSAGVAMVLWSAWGFGESYAAAPHLQGWLIVPLFWLVSAVVWPFVRSSR